MAENATTATPLVTGAPLGFGRVFTEHVARSDYDAEGGWSPVRVEPYAPVALDPAASALHYGQAVFEGLKAYRGVDGRVRFFRLADHARRFARSCEAVCIPQLEPARFAEAVRGVVRRDIDRVPVEPESSLYIRPFAFATEAFLGVCPATQYAFLVILSPVGAYYAKGFGPVRIWVEQQAVRAAPGGLGGVKTAANYAASLRAAWLAKERGYDQVLWTDAREHRLLEEVGTMNLFVRLGDRVITPPAGDTILPGITRASVVTLLRDRGVEVEERTISLDEVRAGAADGTLREIFGTGTAAVVSPVGALGLPDGDLVVGDGGAGPLARALYRDICAIQRGEAEDRWGWTEVLEPS